MRRSEPCRLECGGDGSFFRRFRALPSTLRLSRNCPADNLCLMRISFPPTPSTLRLSNICPTDRLWLMANLFSILRPQHYGYQKFVLRTTFASWQIYFPFYVLNTTAIKNLSCGQDLPHGKSITHSSPSTLRLSKICPADNLCLIANLLPILRSQRYGYRKFVLRTSFV